MLQNMAVDVHLPVADPKPLVMVNRDALVQFQGGQFVYVVDEGLAKLTPVEVAARDGERIGVVSEALSEGAEVVVDGNDRLRPDQPVQVVNAY